MSPLAAGMSRGDGDVALLDSLLTMTSFCPTSAIVTTTMESWAVPAALNVRVVREALAVLAPKITQRSRPESQG